MPSLYPEIQIILLAQFIQISMRIEFIFIHLYQADRNVGAVITDTFKVRDHIG